MIARDTLNKKHIEAELKRMKMADPAVLERTMHAFVLLERLAISSMVGGSASSKRRLPQLKPHIWRLCC